MAGVEGERRRESLSQYRQNGLIPGWSEVDRIFRLTEKFPPGDCRLLMAYYRAQRRMAEGKYHKGSRIMEALDRNSDFKDLEETGGSVLSEISSFIRHPSERRRSR